jgi:transposase-like protein
VLVAVGVDEEGYRDVLGVQEGAKEDKASWYGFLQHLKARGLKGTELFITDKCMGLVESVTEVFPEAKWQRCMVHWYRNVMSRTPRSKLKDVVAMLKAIHAQEDPKSALKKAVDVERKLLAMKLPEAARVVREGVEETLRYMSFPREHWIRIRTTSPVVPFDLNTALFRLKKPACHVLNQCQIPPQTRKHPTQQPSRPRLFEHAGAVREFGFRRTARKR